MNFGDFALVVAAGLAGPLLAASRPALVPVVVGEILAGVVIGRTGLRAIHPGDPTLASLSDIGFAMLMLAAGMHVPLRDKRLLAALGRGGTAAVIVAVASVPAGLLAAQVAGTGHAAVYAVVLASGSAAIVLPILLDRGLTGPDALVVMAQVTIADIATIVAVPLVLQPSRAAHAALGTALVAAGALAVFGATRVAHGRAWVHELRGDSKRLGWALDLRLALLVLFGLAWLAQKSGTSLLIAGFGAGLMVAAVGGPKRLSGQVLGIAQGFFVPLFFVVLGAKLDLRALLHQVSLVELVATLVALNVAVHVIAAAVTRQRVGAGLVATAQLGVPAAVVALGLSENVIAPGQGAAIIAGALVSLGVCSAGAAMLRGSGTGAAQPAAAAKGPA